MEKNLVTAKKLSNAISIIAKIIRVFLIIGFVFTVLTSIVFLAMPKNFFTFEVVSKADVTATIKTDEDLSANFDPSSLGRNEFDIEIGNNYVRFSLDNAQFSLNNYHLGVIMWCYAIETAALYAVLLFVGKLFKNVSDSRTPFTSRTYEIIKQLGIVLIVYAAVPGIMSGILLEIMGVKGNIFSVGYDISLSTVIVVLAYIAGMFLFKYIVQKENLNEPAYTEETGSDEKK